MTVDALTPSITYPYSGAGDYPFSFDAADEEHLLLTYTSTAGVVTTLALNDDYSVTLSEELGGTCSLTYSASDGTLKISRRTPVTQPLRLINNNALDMAGLEAALDRMVMVIQDFGVDIDELLTEFSWRGTWATGSAYVLRDIVVSADSDVYICVEAHTAGTFATDLANGKWALLVDVSSVITNKDAAEAAQAAAEAAQTECETIQDTIADLVATAAAAEASAQQCADDAAASAASINAFVNITSNTTLTEAQCTNTLVTNYGASAGVLNITLPALSKRVKFEIWNESTVSLVQVIPPSGEQFFIHDVGLLAVDNAALFPLPPSGGEVFTLRRVRLPSSAYRWQIERLYGEWV